MIGKALQKSENWNDETYSEWKPNMIDNLGYKGDEWKPILAILITKVNIKKLFLPL